MGNDFLSQLKDKQLYFIFLGFSPRNLISKYSSLRWVSAHLGSIEDNGYQKKRERMERSKGFHTCLELDVVMSMCLISEGYLNCLVTVFKKFLFSNIHLCKVIYSR